MVFEFASFEDETYFRGEDFNSTNLSPRYIEPYEIIEKLNLVAYRLDLPTKLEHVHNIFHILQLRKYVPDPSHIIIAELVEIVENLIYKECPIQILDKKLSNFGTKAFLWLRSCGPAITPLRLHGK